MVLVNSKQNYETLECLEDKLDFLRSNSLHHLSCLLLNSNAKILLLDSNCGVGYSVHKKAAVVIGGIMAPSERLDEIGDRFLKWCKDKGLSPLFVHMSEHDSKYLVKRGFRTNQLGASYSLRFDRFASKGKKYRQVRRKLNNAMRSGVTSMEITSASEFEDVKGRLVEINHNWLKSKGAKKIKILVSDFDELIIPSDEHRLFIAKHEGVVTSYIIFSRTYGADAGWFHNLSRRDTICVDGTMQLIVTSFLNSLKNETLHFGFTPLVEMKDDNSNGSKVFSKIANFLSGKGGIVYPARAQRQYKVSWNPNIISSETLAYQGAVLPNVLNLLTATNSI